MSILYENDDEKTSKDSRKIIEFKLDLTIRSDPKYSGSPPLPFTFTVFGSNQTKNTVRVQAYTKGTQRRN